MIADAILVVHFLIVLFNLGGLMVVWIGAPRRLVSLTEDEARNGAYSVVPDLSTAANVILGSNDDPKRPREA